MTTQHSAYRRLAGTPQQVAERVAKLGPDWMTRPMTVADGQVVVLCGFGAAPPAVRPVPGAQVVRPVSVPRPEAAPETAGAEEFLPPRWHERHRVLLVSGGVVVGLVGLVTAGWVVWQFVAANAQFLLGAVAVAALAVYLWRRRRRGGRGHRWCPIPGCDHN